MRSLYFSRRVDWLPQGYASLQTPYIVLEVAAYVVYSHMEQSTDCIVHVLYVLSSNFRGIPFSWSFRPAVSFTAGMDPLSLRSGADHPFHCVATNRKWCLQSNTVQWSGEPLLALGVNSETSA